MSNPQKEHPTMSPDAQAIRSIANHYAAAWNQHDAKSFPEYFAEDADFVTFQGTWIKGRTGIQTAHQFIFDGPFKNTTIRYLEDTLALRGSDAAVLRAKWELTGADANGAAFAARTGIFIFVFHRVAGQWRLVAGQNTDIDSQQIYHAA
jgi:uncharacterized protein (TIGR02246 family)